MAPMAVLPGVAVGRAVCLPGEPGYPPRPSHVSPALPPHLGFQGSVLGTSEGLLLKPSPPTATLCNCPWFMAFSSVSSPGDRHFASFCLHLSLSLFPFIPRLISSPPSKVVLPLEPPVVVPGRPLVFTVDGLLRRVTVRIHGEVRSFWIRNPAGTSVVCQGRGKN